MHKPEHVLDNEKPKILFDFEIQTDHLNSARRLDRELMNKKTRTYHRVDFELRAIRDIVIDNRYPEDVIDSNIKYTVTKFRNTNKIFGPLIYPVYFGLLWVGLLPNPLQIRLLHLCIIAIML